MSDAASRCDPDPEEHARLERLTDPALLAADGDDVPEGITEPGA